MSIAMSWFSWFIITNVPPLPGCLWPAPTPPVSAWWPGTVLLFLLCSGSDAVKIIPDDKVFNSIMKRESGLTWFHLQIDVLILHPSRVIRITFSFLTKHLWLSGILVQVLGCRRCRGRRLLRSGGEGGVRRSRWIRVQPKLQGLNSLFWRNTLYSILFLLNCENRISRV